VRLFAHAARFFPRKATRAFGLTRRIVLLQALRELLGAGAGLHQLIARDGKFGLQLRDTLLGGRTRLGKFTELRGVLRGGTLQSGEFRIQQRGALLGGSPQFRELGASGLTAGAQVCELRGESGGVLLGGEARLVELTDLHRMLVARGLVSGGRRDGVRSTLLGGAVSLPRFIAFAFQIAQPVGLAVEQLLR
jgi:hypothetical protein